MTGWEPTTLDAQRTDRPLASPFYDWVKGGDRLEVYDKVSDWVPVLIEFRDFPKHSAQRFTEHVFGAQRRSALGGGALGAGALGGGAASWEADVRIPGFYEQLSGSITGPLRFIAILARQSFLTAIEKGDPPAEQILRFELGLATRTLELKELDPPAVPILPFTHVGKPEVVTAVIDDGIAFAHDRLWDSDRKTRVEYVWDQLVPNEPFDYLNYGREIFKHLPVVGIDDLMDDCRHAQLVDEDEVYQRSDQINHQASRDHQPLAARQSHGAHVMDIACALPARPDPGARPVIAVQLPVPTVEDTSGATLSPQIYNGLLYILWRADKIANDTGATYLPVVVNVSYGTIAGPHDGRSTIEGYIDHLIEVALRPLRVVLPAGNNHLSRCHARLSLSPGESRELAWRVLPDDQTDSYLEIYIPMGLFPAPPTVEFSITAPDGAASKATIPGGGQLYRVDGVVVGQALYYPPGSADNSATRALVRFSLNATGAPEGGYKLAPAGLWRVTLTHTGASKVIHRIDAWIQRDDAAPGYRQRGRQSYFDDPDYKRFNDGGRAIEVDSGPSYVRRRRSLNAIATGTRTIVVAGYRLSDGAIAAQSASGPASYPGRKFPGTGPDAAWPTETTPSHRGLLAAGTRSGSCVMMNGTSVAAPQAAWWVASRWVACPPSVHAWVGRIYLYFVAKWTRGWPPGVPSERGGGGRMTHPVQRKPRFEP